MDLWQKINLLGQAAQYDACQGCGTHMHRTRDDIGRWIYPAVRPDGKRVRLLKVLQSSVCQNDCAYCVFRSGRDVQRSSLTPDELARVFSELVQARRAEGLFLSSGVCGRVAQATERMLATVELVRRRYNFRGYVHLKILPGADDASIEASLKLAQRVSVNLEAPSAARLAHLSQGKDFDRQLLAPLRTAHRMRREMGAPVSMTTQYVVGASDESDRELLQTTSGLYGSIQLDRAYYSAFQPRPQTPLEDHAATPLWREHRLYQADFLLRQYGFTFDDLVFDGQGNLPQSADPKMTWALCHPERFPIELNTASREDLLRVPGIGAKAATEILGRRRQGHLRELDHLGLPNALAQRAAPFVLLGGERPPFQPSLWGSMQPA